MPKVFYSFIVVNLLTTLHSTTLRKSEILKNRRLIEQLFTKGKSCKASFLRVIYTRFASQEALQSWVLVMFVVSKKNVRHAVKRNRIKRLMREAYRLEKVQLVDAVSQQEMVPIAVAIAYTGKASQIPPLALFRRELRELFTALSASNVVGEVS